MLLIGFAGGIGGSIAADEEQEPAVAREIKKELGVNVEILEKLGDNEYVANHPEKGKTRKVVCYYLARAAHEELQLEKDSGGLDDARWFEAAEVSDLRMYADITEIVRKAVERIIATYLPKA
jgi:NADH pyrophosphatase NudC (nudix superfamily)